jgi:hypothetical protein
VCVSYKPKQLTFYQRPRVFPFHSHASPSRAPRGSALAKRDASECAPYMKGWSSAAMRRRRAKRRAWETAGWVGGAAGKWGGGRGKVGLTAARTPFFMLPARPGPSVDRAGPPLPPSSDGALRPSEASKA